MPRNAELIVVDSRPARTPGLPRSSGNSVFSNLHTVLQICYFTRGPSSTCPPLTLHPPEFYLQAATTAYLSFTRLLLWGCSLSTLLKSLLSSELCHQSLELVINYFKSESLTRPL